jgi:site-specific recombinase XerD
MNAINHNSEGFGDVDFWLSEWLKSSRRNSVNTALAYQTDVRQFLDERRKPFDQIAVTDILEYQSSLADRYAPRTAARKVASVRSFYRFLCNREVMALNLARIESPKIEQTISHDKMLTEKEVQAIINATADDHHRIFVRFLYLTAVRISEALAVRWRDLTYLGGATGQAHIVGKGNKHRDVFLPEELWCDIASLEDISTSEASKSDRLVFSFIKDRVQALRIVRGLAKAAKISKSVSPHSFRHAHISHALQNGATVADLRDQAGHSNIRTTSLYVHTNKERATATRLKIR